LSSFMDAVSNGYELFAVNLDKSLPSEKKVENKQRRSRYNFGTR